ncbi:MAG: hypothetical protein MUE68_04050 [Bacteroidetes bacterium]|jgi:hypothetical protein|nr:hypothetical protein [Bacteroidota bacterium]
MLKETYEGRGPTPEEARTTANAKCDAWITIQQREGRRIIDEGRGSVTTKVGTNAYECEITLMYRLS